MLYDATMIVDTCHYIYLSKLTKYIAYGVNPNVKYGLWMIAMNQCKLINYNKCHLGARCCEGGGRLPVSAVFCVLMGSKFI